MDGSYLDLSSVNCRWVKKLVPCLSLTFLKVPVTTATSRPRRRKVLKHETVKNSRHDIGLENSSDSKA
jgi:hypothetical protein